MIALEPVPWNAQDPADDRVHCPACEGDGVHVCSTCSGRGWVREDEFAELVDNDDGEDEAAVKPLFEWQVGMAGLHPVNRLMLIEGKRRRVVGEVVSSYGGGYRWTAKLEEQGKGVEASVEAAKVAAMAHLLGELFERVDGVSQ